MRFVLYLLGLLNAFLCTIDIIDILNGDTTRYHIFMTIFTGAFSIACFVAVLNSLLNNYYKEDKDE